MAVGSDFLRHLPGVGMGRPHHNFWVCRRRRICADLFSIRWPAVYSGTERATCGGRNLPDVGRAAADVLAAADQRVSFCVAGKRRSRALDADTVVAAAADVAMGEPAR